MAHRDDLPWTGFDAEPFSARPTSEDSKAREPHRAAFDVGDAIDRDILETVDGITTSITNSWDVTSRVRRGLHEAELLATSHREIRAVVFAQDHGDASDLSLALKRIGCAVVDRIAQVRELYSSVLTRRPDIVLVRITGDKEQSRHILAAVTELTSRGIVPVMVISDAEHAEFAYLLHIVSTRASMSPSLRAEIEKLVESTEFMMYQQED